MGVCSVRLLTITRVREGWSGTADNGSEILGEMRDWAIPIVGLGWAGWMDGRMLMALVLQLTLDAILFGGVCTTAFP